MSTLRRLLMAHNMNQIRYPADSTVWEVTIPEGEASYQFFIRNRSISSVIDWGDGVVETLSAEGDKRPAHTYQAGSYTVSLTGKYDLLYLGDGNATYGKFVTGLVQVSEELTDYSSLCKHCAITELPTRFTIPYGVKSVSGMFESCKIPYLPDGFSLPDTVLGCSRMFYAAKIASLPDSFVLPKSVTNLSDMFWAISNLKFDIGHFLQNIATSGSINIERAFGACSSITGTAPADKLWGNSNVTWRATNCFMNCRNISNYNEIPAAWGGGGA